MNYCNRILKSWRVKEKNAVVVRKRRMRVVRKSGHRRALVARAAALVALPRTLLQPVSLTTTAPVTRLITLIQFEITLFSPQPSVCRQVIGRCLCNFCRSVASKLSGNRHAGPDFNLCIGYKRLQAKILNLSIKPIKITKNCCCVFL